MESRAKGSSDSHQGMSVTHEKCILERTVDENDDRDESKSKLRFNTRRDLHMHILVIIRRIENVRSGVAVTIDAARRDTAFIIQSENDVVARRCLATRHI